MIESINPLWIAMPHTYLQDQRICFSFQIIQNFTDFLPRAVYTFDVIGYDDFIN